MKSMLIVLMLAVVSFESISGNSFEDFIHKQIAKLEQEAEKKLESLVGPLENDAKQLIDEIEKIKYFANVNSVQCQQLTKTLQEASSESVQITVNVLNTALKIKKDILQLETACQSETSLNATVQCIKKNFITVVQDIENIEPTCEKYANSLSTLGQEIRQEFIQCLESGQPSSSTSSPVVVSTAAAKVVKRH